MFARRLINYPAVAWGNPFADFDRMFKTMDRWNRGFFGSPSLGWGAARVFPSLKITEDKENYYVRAELPGMKTDDLDVQVHGKNLTISGERKIHVEGDNIRYHRKERDAGKFSRIIELPGDIDVEKVNAKMVNGVLTITLAKAESAKPRQISVH